ncbi:putative apyrase 6 [Acorus calamus]|uniref:Apyrase 6 n=1 Tax=Acorus calamus TaxID=4465 RepID=A0AAV9CS74_ACOCL|nr:putative apyrase 6 [Acorus calamus]
MDSLKNQLRPSPLSAARFDLLSRISPSNKQRSRGDLWISAAVAFAATIAAFLLFAALVARGWTSSDEEGYWIVIDGGSTGTRIHVYRFRRGALLPVVDFGEGGQSAATMKVHPGLSSYADRPERAGESLVELLEFGKGRVPRERWADTEVRLMATAGLRLLDRRVQERVLTSCRRVLRASGFRFQDDWASVISGADEGMYAWVAANYALGTLGGDPRQTTGIIELGGASAQNVAHESLRDLLISRGRKLSSESVQREMLSDPCTPRGYSHGPSKISDAGSDANIEHVPTIHATAGQRFCGEDWPKLRRKYHFLDEEDLSRYCFSSAYIVALLHDGLGIALDDQRIVFANEVGGIPLDWSLGAFLVQKTEDLKASRSDWIARIMSDDSSTLLSLFFISTVLGVAAWSVSKWRKPQLKTIYDLEKGRYIVTRIGSR